MQKLYLCNHLCKNYIYVYHTHYTKIIYAKIISRTRLYGTDVDESDMTNPLRLIPPCDDAGHRSYAESMRLTVKSIWELERRSVCSQCPESTVNTRRERLFTPRPQTSASQDNDRAVAYI